MTPPKPRTNGAAGLSWPTITKILAPIGIMLLITGATLWAKVDRVDQALRYHYEADMARDAATAEDVAVMSERLHAVELSVAAMQGGE